MTLSENKIKVPKPFAKYSNASAAMFKANSPFFSSPLGAYTLTNTGLPPLLTPDVVVST